MRKLLLILLALFLPPIAVFLARGFGKHFFLNLLLTLVVFFPGMVHALYLLVTDPNLK